MSTQPPDAALDELAEAVDALGKGVSTGGVRPPRPLDARRLVSELQREWERANGRRLVGPREEEEEGDDRTVIPIPSPAEVLDRWQREGGAWVQTCSRLDLRALTIAAKDPTVGPVLLVDGAFWPSLKARVRDRQADQVLNTGYFIAGNLAWIEAAIRPRARLSPAGVPRWWVDPGPAAGPLAAAVARAAATATFGEVLEQLGLPEALPEAFMASVARASQATQAVELTALRTFLDRGVELSSRAMIFESTREWARRATLMGDRFPRERLALAELLRRRIGEISAGRDDARWTGIEAQRRTVRTWLVGEIFRVLFSHLVPEGPHEHQTRPRQTFWSRYDQSVEKIWLLICDDHRDGLDRDEAVAQLQRHGLLEVLRFTGQPEQDGLWMQLRTSRGEQVTILEGNANMPIRIRLGAFRPPSGVVDYYRAKLMFQNSSETTSITHQGDWQSRACNTLSERSIYPRETR